MQDSKSPTRLTSAMLECEGCGKQTQTLYQGRCQACNPVPVPRSYTPAYPRNTARQRLEHLRQIEMLLGKIKNLAPATPQDVDPQEAAAWERIQNKIKEIFE